MFSLRGSDVTIYGACAPYTKQWENNCTLTQNSTFLYKSLAFCKKFSNFLLQVYSNKYIEAQYKRCLEDLFSRDWCFCHKVPIGKSWLYSYIRSMQKRYGRWLHTYRDSALIAARRRPTIGALPSHYRTAIGPLAARHPAQIDSPARAFWFVGDITYI